MAFNLMLDAFFVEDKTMANDKDKVLDYIGYVFLYYKLQKLLDMGSIC